jgi:hypothetical protein
MKIELTKKGMTRWCQESELELMKSAGWQPKSAEGLVKLVEEQIVLKPPAKSKGAVKSLDNAIESKGD